MQLVSLHDANGYLRQINIPSYNAAGVRASDKSRNPVDETH